VLISLIVAFHTTDTTVRWDDSCLRFKRGSVAGMPFDSGGIPNFLMPTTDDRATINLKKGQTGLGLSFIYATENAYENSRRRYQDGSGPYAECPVTPFSPGLVRFEQSNVAICSRLASKVSWKSTKYRSSEFIDGVGIVQIRCGNHPAIVGCSMHFLLENDWTARVSLPKTMIDDWQAVAENAAQFFEDNLTDCR